MSAPAFNQDVERTREIEYPALKDAVYLDHAGTSLCPKSLMDRFYTDMISNLYGNPHSASASSQLSTMAIENVRLRVLRFFRADPEDFDVVFVANATAGIKLVADAFRDYQGDFLYRYHKDSHTSLVGVREYATASLCLDDEEVERWLSGSAADDSIETVSQLFAYPAQSNMNGGRFPLSWVEGVRNKNTSSIQTSFTLLDAAAYVTTSQLNLSKASRAPDFTVVSFYKIFGFPDLGALIVRKESGSVLRNRKYFGGGTVDMVLCLKETWHQAKQRSLHESLEDGTLPIHSIMALNAAMDVHTELYGSMDRVSRHVAFLAQNLYDGLKNLRHANSQQVCEIYVPEGTSYLDQARQGPIISFNVRNSYGAWISITEFEKLASIRNFHIRTGGLCNPGGIASSLGLEPWEMKRNFSAGFRCGSDRDVMGGKPTGVIRVSLGAMSTMDDVEKFIAFVKEFYSETELPEQEKPIRTTRQEVMVVESLAIYPIKSCGGQEIPRGVDWEVRKEGLVWDREWFLVHRGTGQALSQKAHPRMVLIKPTIDTEAGLLRLRRHGQSHNEICVPLSADPSVYTPLELHRSFSSRVCGDTITARTYKDESINNWFSHILAVPCALARFPAGGMGTSSRHSKAHMQKHQKPRGVHGRSSSLPSEPPTPPDSDTEASRKQPILLSNESPILAINKSSLNALNMAIAKRFGKLASASVFRANIVLASPNDNDNQEIANAYEEDHWSRLRIGNQEFRMLGSCRRCHMICVDQDTAVRDEEPFVSLAKTRRFEGKVFFGEHMCLVAGVGGSGNGKGVRREEQFPTIRVGDAVEVLDG